MLRRWLFASLLLAGLVGVALWDTRPLQKKYNLLILTVESWRIDALTADTSPTVLAFARDGIRFDAHRAISAWTIPNIAAVLTGASPFEQGIHRAGTSLAPTAPRPLTTLRNQGWTVAGLQPFMAIAEFEGLGISVTPGEELRPWLARRALDRRPFVLWHHYLETHLPYAPEAAFRPDWKALLPPGDPGAEARIEAVMTQPVIPSGSIAFHPADRPAIAALHRGSYRQFDAWFASLLDFLQKSGLLETTLIVLTADHGDEHLEHGRLGHASTNHDGTLHDEVLRIPLVLWLPPDHPARQTGAGQPRIETQPTDHLLIMPSLTRLLHGIPDLPGGLLSPDPDRIWTGATSHAGFKTAPDDDTLLVAAADTRWKLLARWTGTVLTDETLYDLQTDPGETRPAAAPAERLTALRGALRDRLATLVPPYSSALPPPPTLPTEAPHWIWPATDGPLTYDMVAGRFRLEWSGPPAARYRIEYEAGSGPSAFVGHLDIDGTSKDFGTVGRDYWNTFVVPYGHVRLRVGSNGLWSPWRNVEVRP